MPAPSADFQFTECSISRLQRMSRLTGRSAATVTAVRRQLWAYFVEEVGVALGQVV